MGDRGLTVTVTVIEMMTRRRTQQSNTDKVDRRKTNNVWKGGRAVVHHDHRGVGNDCILLHQYA